MYLLSQGDLCQLSDQRRFLEQRGFDIERVDVYSGVETEQEYVSAIRALYQSCVNGWWNYRDDLIKHGVCTIEEFQAKLKRSVESNRRG